MSPNVNFPFSATFWCFSQLILILLTYFKILVDKAMF